MKSWHLFLLISQQVATVSNKNTAIFIVNLYKNENKCKRKKSNSTLTFNNLTQNKIQSYIVAHKKL